MMSWLIAAVAASAVAGAPKTDTHAPPVLSPPCRQALTVEWKAAVQAFGAKQFDQAQTLAAKVAAACDGDPPARPMIATFSADIALQTGKPKAAVDALDLAPPGEDNSLWLQSVFIYLSAFKALDDDARFRAERDHLVAVNEAHLLADGDWLKQERFETPIAWVDAYRRRTRKGEPNDTLFIATPKAAEMPASYEQNEGALSGLMGALTGNPKERDEIGDLNECAMHASLTPTKADYAAWRARAVELFSDPESFSHTGQGPDICPSWIWIFPALAPPADDDKSN